MSGITVSIITPTYNRGEKLRRLYESLKAQTTKDFKWIVIDDGSSDDTFEIMERIKKRHDEFEIVYVKKENGGKHTALNLAFGMLENEGLAIIVDSDDYLVNEAVETIKRDWNMYATEKLCGLCYKRMDANGEDICDDFGSDAVVANYNDFIVNAQRIGDKAEVFRNDILSEVRYPEYAGEKFLSEGVLWSQIAHGHDMIFINKPIYVCEYLDGGLTRSGRGMRIKNPKGGMYYSREYLDRRYSWYIRQKNALLFLVYARFAGVDIVGLCRKNAYRLLLLLNLIPSFIAHKYWLRKYGGEK